MKTKTFKIPAVQRHPFYMNSSTRLGLFISTLPPGSPSATEWRQSKREKKMSEKRGKFNDKTLYNHWPLTGTQTTHLTTRTHRPTHKFWSTYYTTFISFYKIHIYIHKSLFSLIITQKILRGFFSWLRLSFHSELQIISSYESKLK